MKKTRQITALVLILALSVALAACGESAPTGLWADAQYTEDTELGEGAKTVTVAVTAEETTVTFTIHTDGENLRTALEENGLVSGDESEYGLYVKVVDGMTADYDADGAYWAFYSNGEYLMTGVDDTVISDGDSYEIVYTAA